MLKVLRPTNNKQTGNPSTHGYVAWDFSGKGEPDARSSIYGKVTRNKNSETKNWKSAVLTDKGNYSETNYGNFCKIEGEVDGKKIIQILAHMEPNSVVPVGTEVKAGQYVGKIGHTGWSTAKHLHTEYRDSSGKNIHVEFVDKIEENIPMSQEPTNQKQQIIDTYLGTRPNLPPSDDEINARLQQNKNLVELIKDILGGDGKSREYWLDEWDIDQSDMDWEETAKGYEDSFRALKEIYRLAPIDDTEKVLGAAKQSQKRILELEKMQEPKTLYKVEGKDFELFMKFGNIRLVIER